MAIRYNAPISGTPSTVGGQIILNAYERKAVIELAKVQFFTQLATKTAMPKNYGQTIEVFQWIPLIDDRNLNDQGIDAAGVTIDSTKFYVTLPGLTASYAVSGDATAAAAAINAIEAGVAVVSGAGPYTVTVSKVKLLPATSAQANAVTSTTIGAVAVQGSGNMYGSSKDIGVIAGKMPVLSEEGGRVNRVGFTRKVLSGTFIPFGFFHEYTAASMNFDTEADLYENLVRETMNGANQAYEAKLQADLLLAAATVQYAGSATSRATMNATSIISYKDIMRLGIALDNNRTPKQTTISTGTKNIDTRTIPACRVAYVGTELIPILKAMKDLHNFPAFISVEKYAAGTDTLIGEIGVIDQFRIIQVPEMLNFHSVGAVDTSGNFLTGAGNKLNAYPFLVVGDDSFTTISFQSDGKSAKFIIKEKRPDDNVTTQDPYGEIGFMSIKWFYGFLAWRPERIGVIWSIGSL